MNELLRFKKKNCLLTVVEGVVVGVVDGLVLGVVLG